MCIIFNFSGEQVSKCKYFETCSPLKVLTLKECGSITPNINSRETKFRSLHETCGGQRRSVTQKFFLRGGAQP